jgi:hypothetical protein
LNDAVRSHRPEELIVACWAGRTALTSPRSAILMIFRGDERIANRVPIPRLHLVGFGIAESRGLNVLDWRGSRDLERDKIVIVTAGDLVAPPGVSAP